MSTEIPKDTESTPRTEDEIITESTDFSSMLLDDKICGGLKKLGFDKPTPVQLKAIPVGLLGNDFVMKAKSGTGKTAASVIIALKKINIEKRELQAIILTPRETAFKIRDFFMKIGSEIPGLKVHHYLGGTPVERDAKSIKLCHVAIATPGRMEHITLLKPIKFDTVRILVLDTADQLLSLKDMRKSVKRIFKRLPEKKQIILSTATHREALEYLCANFMHAPIQIKEEENQIVCSKYKQDSRKLDTVVSINTETSHSCNKSETKCNCPDELFVNTISLDRDSSDKDWCKSLCEKHSGTIEFDSTQTNNEKIKSIDQENSNKIEIEIDKKVAGEKRKSETSDNQRCNDYADNAQNSTSLEEFDDDAEVSRKKPKHQI